MSEIINVNGKEYMKGAMERWNCDVCYRSVLPHMNGVFWRVSFTEEINRINDSKAYKNLKDDYFGSYLCNGCLVELLVNSPEVIKKLTKVFP